MKNFYSMIAVAACAIIALAAPLAHADGLYSPLTVTVWTGANTTDMANLPTPNTPANFTFTYSGPLDFTNSNPANTFAQFFGSYVSDISGISTTALNTLLADTMSTPGETAPGAINSYLSFAGSYTATSPSWVTISHDDGASLYLNGSMNPTINSAAPTSEIPSSGWVPGGTNTFDLIYVESNGAPADLVVTGLTPTPEPGTIGFMALGLISLAGIAYRGTAFSS